MDSSWTKVRQMVANRVLTRHLQDLHDQQVAMEVAQDQQKRRLERELRASRNKAGSMQIDSIDSLIPDPPRRHSLPVSPRPPANSTPPPSLWALRSDLAGDNMAEGSDRPTLNLNHSDITTLDSGHDADCDLLDLMATTLHSARSMEQQRPTLYLQTSLGRPGKEPSGLHTRGSTKMDRPLAASLKSQRVKAAAHPASSQLDKGESFLQTDRSQVLSLEAVSSLAAATPKPDTPQRKGEKTKRKRQKKGGISNSITEGQHTVDHADSVGAKYEYRRGSTANVDFYDNDTGLKKEDGGFTPKDLPLHLNMLEEEDDEMDDDCIGEEEEEEMASCEEVELEEEDPWNAVRKCQYIRGYDPPHMRMPKDAVKFVFGDSGQT